MGRPTETKKKPPTPEELLVESKDILREVDESGIFKDVVPREFPTFDRDELGLGRILGVGGFCVVREVLGMRLKTKGEEEEEKMPNNNSHVELVQGNGGSDDDEEGEENEKHLEVSTARSFMEKYYLRNGNARYAVKKLRTDLSDLEKVRGRIDLVIETKFLSSLSHPNIVHMRGMATGDPMSETFFVVLDRLFGILLDKMDEWKVTTKKLKGFLGVAGKKNKEALRDLMIEKLIVAYDLAAAFRYMHSHNLIYRDIKPENIGFDVRGDVKVFDFGLCKDMNPKYKTQDGLFQLTFQTGSRPYMAPEVALHKPYNQSADVFSYGILLSEIFSLKLPFQGMTNKEFKEQVLIGGKREKLPKSVPPFTAKLVTECWDANLQERPTFSRIASVIRGDLNGLTADSTVQNRTTHMLDRSARSNHGVVVPK